MSKFVIDLLSAEPPFEQLRRQVAEGVTSGDLPPGHKLPTVRTLAADLGLANNTVARAYRELESDSVIETQGRKGTFVASRKMSDEVAQSAAATYVHAARTQGLSKDEALRLVTEAW